MIQTEIGKMLEGPQERDAIHVAVACVRSDEELEPGQHVGIVEDGMVSSTAAPPQGIIDPFLLYPVPPGKHCWLFLYPNTITSLKHNWTHPAFPAAESPSALLEKFDAAKSKRWLRRFAEQCGEDYDLVVNSAKEFLEHGQVYTQMGTETLRDSLWAQAKRDEFWGHIEVVTGIKVRPEEKAENPFSCSC
jgi:hypothetical protein